MPDWLRLPDIGDWLSQQDIKGQNQIEFMFMLGPFFVSWMVFSYFWVGRMWSVWDSLPGPLIIGTVGYIGFFKYSEHVKGEAVSLDSINMTVRWTESITREVQNVIDDWEILEESEQGGLTVAPGLEYWHEAAVKYCPMCGVPVAYPNGFNNGEKKIYPKNCHSCGSLLPEHMPTYSTDVYDDYFFSKMKFKNTEVDPWGVRWYTGVFVHEYPKDNVLRRQPGQWVSHKGLMFPMPSANIDVTYLGSREELEHEKYFLVTSDPERTRRIQMGIGLTPANASLEEVNKARNLSTVKLGLKWLLEWRDEASTNKVLMETKEDSDIRAHADAADFYRNKDIVTRDLNVLRQVQANWKAVLGTIIGIGLLYWILQYWNFI